MTAHVLPRLHAPQGLRHSLTNAHAGARAARPLIFTNAHADAHTAKPLMFSDAALYSLLIPIIIEQFLNALMGMADTMMISNLGSAAISAVSLTDSINTLMIQVFAALAAGGTVICSQYLGQQNIAQCNKAAKQLLLIILVLSGSITMFCLMFKRPLLAMIFGQVSEEVMDASLIYFGITVLSYPFFALFQGGAGLYRACGDSRLPMRISIITNMMNIAGNAVLVFVVQMGVAGAALSTLVSPAIAAQAMTAILENVNGIAGCGVGIGMMTVVGQCLGAGYKDQAVYYIKKLTAWAEAVIIASCLIVYMMSGAVVRLAGMEPDAAELCLKMVLLITVVKPIFWAMSFIPAYGFRAAGDVKFTMIVSSLTMWLCRVAGSIFMIRVLHLGILSVWIGMFMDWAVRGIIYRIHFVRGTWLKKSVIE